MSATEIQVRLYQKLCDDLGSQILQHLQDPEVLEIILNPDGSIWIDSINNGQIKTGNLSISSAYSILNTVAGINGLVISFTHPKLEAKLPFYKNLRGERMTGSIPPIVSSPCFTIRKQYEGSFTLDDYIHSQRISLNQANLLRQMIKERKNILVCGGPGSGKTTLSNALIREAVNFNPQQRIVVLEDLAELQCSATNCVSMLTSENVSMRDLLHLSMRMRPDRILIGEVRGGEALDMLKAWNTGCPGGIGTIHANGAAEAVQRLLDLVQENSPGQIPLSLIQYTLDAIVSMRRQGYQKGFLHQIVALRGQHHEKFIFETLG